MATNYYEIRYLNSDGTQSARAYTYFSRMDLVLGQKVICPTARNPRQPGIVFAVNCPKPPFDCREITELAPEDDDG